MRIVCDHVRSAVMATADGILPSNVERGYIVRRLIRRAIRHGLGLGIEGPFLAGLATTVVREYADLYAALASAGDSILREIGAEEERFAQTLQRGLGEFAKLVEQHGEGSIAGREAFDLYATYGFPLELTEELAAERGLRVDAEGYGAAFEEHQRISRAGMRQRFAGGLGDRSDAATRLHTATHLLHAALREVLGPHVEQKGSNITAERLRFDFSHPQPLTEEELQKIEDLVNLRTQEDLGVSIDVMTLEEAKASGALAFFAAKYGDAVKVSSVGGFSREVCGGPHVASTGELGRFTIIKEQSSGRGVRRVRAVLEMS